jgi:hypothetical protein
MKEDSKDCGFTVRQNSDRCNENLKEFLGPVHGRIVAVADR